MTTMEDQQSFTSSSGRAEPELHIAGLGRSASWTHRVLRSRGVPSSELPDQACMLQVHVETATLEHHGPDQSYRPYLYLTGELRAVLPDPEAPEQAEWPYNITAITFAPATGETVCGFYEFDDEQLRTLVGKGLFWRGFEAPESITGFEWELPATADLCFVDPVSPDDVPLVSVSVHDISALETDLGRSGYDLASYFPDRAEQIAQAAQPAREMGVKSRDDEFDNLFAGETQTPGVTPVEVSRPALSDGLLLSEQLRQPDGRPELADRLAQVLAEVDAGAEADHQAYLRAQATGDTENVEALFEQYVAAVLDGDEEPQAATPQEQETVADASQVRDREVDRRDAEIAKAAQAPETGLLDLQEPTTPTTPVADDDWQFG